MSPSVPSVQQLLFITPPRPTSRRLLHTLLHNLDKPLQMPYSLGCGASCDSSDILAWKDEGECGLLIKTHADRSLDAVSE